MKVKDTHTAYRLAEKRTLLMAERKAAVESDSYRIQHDVPGAKPFVTLWESIALDTEGEKDYSALFKDIRNALDLYFARQIQGVEKQLFDIGVDCRDDDTEPEAKAA